MFWRAILTRFSPLYLMFGLAYRGDQALLVLALYHQVMVHQRHLGKRSSLVEGERLALALSGLLPTCTPGSDHDPQPASIDVVR
jgi:hypothetical protein